MIYTINNNTTARYSKFVTRPKWQIDVTLDLDLLVAVHPTIPDAALPEPHDPLSVINQVSNQETTIFQSCELLCWRIDLQFLNLRAYFGNLLKALHVCWLASRNNKRIVFVDQANISNDLSQVLHHSLTKQHSRHTLPRLLEATLAKNANPRDTIGTMDSPSVLDVAQEKKPATQQISPKHKPTKSVTVFNQLFGLLNSVTAGAEMQKKQPPVLTKGFKIQPSLPNTDLINRLKLIAQEFGAMPDKDVDNKNLNQYEGNKHRYDIHKSAMPPIRIFNKNTKYQIKLRAKAAQLSSRQIGFFSSITGSSFLSNSKNAFKSIDNLVHLNNFSASKTNPVHEYVLTKNQIISYPCFAQKFRLLTAAQSLIQKTKVVIKSSQNSSHATAAKEKVIKLQAKKKAKPQSPNIAGDQKDALAPLDDVLLSSAQSHKHLYNQPLISNFSHLLRIQTKAIQQYAPVCDRTNIKNSILPFFNERGFFSIPDLAQPELLNTNRPKTRDARILENPQDNFFARRRINKKYVKSDKTINSFFNRHYVGNVEAGPRFNKRKGKNVFQYMQRPINLKLKSAYLQTYHQHKINTNNYRQCLNFVKNPWLNQADIVFFVNPGSCMNTVMQAKRLNIPTIGLISNSIVNRPGRSGFRTFCYDDYVNYSILGNPSSIFFVRTIMEMFVKVIQTATNNKPILKTIRNR
jgi:hypothetical protein